MLGLPDLQSDWCFATYLCIPVHCFSRVCQAERSWARLSGCMTAGSSVVIAAFLMMLLKHKCHRVVQAAESGCKTSHDDAHMTCESSNRG